jgi:hypothetical protein
MLSRQPSIFQQHYFFRFYAVLFHAVLEGRAGNSQKTRGTFFTANDPLALDQRLFD